MRKISRKGFLFIIYTGILAFFVFLWEMLTRNEIKQTLQVNRQFPYNKSKKVTISGDYIFVNDNDKLTVFSARCTHMGCRIREFKNDKMVCPCHGSEYDLAGTPIKGPAYKNLEKVEAEITPDGKAILITGKS